MKQHDYDKILYRLVTIIGRLSDGEILYKEELAKEFNVSTKTIQRDFNERLVARFPIHKHLNGWKMMEGYHLEKSRAVEDILVVDILRTISDGFGNAFAKRSSSLLNKLTDSTPSAFYTRLAFEVVLHIHTDIKRYILDHPLAPTQHIIEEKEDGSLVIALEITHDKEIISTLQKWMPHVTVLSPKSLQENILQQVKLFLEKQVLL